MPALSAVPAGGDADLTDLPCSCTPPPAWPSILRRRRSPSAARSLLRNPPVRPSWTCGASSGRRLMAPASLHNNFEAARGTRSAGQPRPPLELARDDANSTPGRTVALPPLRPQNAESQDNAGQGPHAPACFLDPAATYNTVLTAPRPTSLAASAADRAGRAGFAPACPIAGGSGGRSQRSLP